MPLFDQGQARIGRAMADLRQAQQAYYALGVRIRSTVRLVHERVQGAQDRALYYRDIVLPLRERIVNEAQLHYNAMQIGVFDLLAGSGAADSGRHRLHRNAARLLVGPRRPRATAQRARTERQWCARWAAGSSRPKYA